MTPRGVLVFVMALLCAMLGLGATHNHVTSRYRSMFPFLYTMLVTPAWAIVEVVRAADAPCSNAAASPKARTGRCALLHAVILLSSLWSIVLTLTCLYVVHTDEKGAAVGAFIMAVPFVLSYPLQYTSLAAAVSMAVLRICAARPVTEEKVD